MAKDINLCVKHFEEFYDLLMQTAPKGYIPWFFSCKANRKDPDPYAILKINPESKGSWHHPSAKLSKEQCIDHIRNGGNIGISARKGDALIIGDVDNPKYFEQLPKNTLIVTSRKREGWHFFGWNKDGTAKTNLPTDDGEIRSDNQYVLACGSYVMPTGKELEELNEQSKNDKLLGYYSITNHVPPRSLTFNDFPQFFKDKEKENIEAEARIKQREEYKSEKIKQGKYDDLFKLKVSDIYGLIPSSKRVSHPLHASETSSNFSLSKDGTLGHCWRHMVSLNAVQYLCVEAGYMNCEDAGTPHKGRGLSKIKGDKKALEVAYDLAIKKGLIEEKVKEEKKVKFPSGILKITNYIQNVEFFHEQQPFFYDKSGMFWFWNWKESKWEMVDEIDLMNSIDDGLSFGGDTVTSKLKSNYLEAFKRIGRKKIPKESPKYCIQFKNKIFNFRTEKIIEATPEYFNCNPIPWELGETDETPVMDKLFDEWVGKDYSDTLKEIIAYCCLTDYPIHMLFCFIGIGSNGKTKFQNMLSKFVGKDNICSTELDDLLDSRFEKAKLYKKLICQMGETNFGTLNKTSLLKKLTGQDLIGYEFKNKKPFDDYSYAKILINSNSLPSSEDTSEGFYRRWMILDFPNQFPEGKDILETIPEHEYNNLALKVTKIIPKLIKRGKFSKQGSIAERKQKYIIASNPLGLFIDNFCNHDPGLFIRYSELYTGYIKYLNKLKRRVIPKREFTKALENEGYEIRKTSKDYNGVWVSDRFIEGIDLKDNFVTLVTFVDVNSTLFPMRETNSKTQHESHKSHNDNTSLETPVFNSFEEVVEGKIENNDNASSETHKIGHIDVSKKSSSKGNEGIKMTNLMDELPKSNKQKIYEVLIDIHNKVDLIYFIDLIKIVKEKHKIDEVECESIVETLKKEGVIYEVKPGVLQVL